MFVKGKMVVRSLGVGLAVALSALTLGGCAGNKVTSFTPDADIKAQVDAAIAPGMPEAQVKSKLSSLGFNHKYQISRREPPGLLARAWPPGGFWVDQEVQTLRYVDVICNLDNERRLVSWQMQRGEITYQFGSPTGPGQDPNRRFPMPPLPPEGWRGGGS